MDDSLRSLRHAIFTSYLDTCRPPTVDELASITGRTAVEINDGLKKLEELHHIVLHGEGVCSPTPIAMAHPFSHLPTPYIVTQDTRSWWANCIWCALGLVSMLPPSPPAKVLTRSGSISATPLTIDVCCRATTPTVRCNGSEEAGAKAVVHFSIRPSQWWRDVRVACGTIQVFESAEEAKRWAERFGWNEGEYISLQTCWELAEVWYHDKGTFEYERKTAEEAVEVYDGLGMTSEFWRS